MRISGNQLVRMYRVEYASTIDQAFLRRLSRADRDRIRRVIEQKLTASPHLFGKPLRFSLFGARTLRVGSYRIIFVIQEDVVRILDLGHRRDIYKTHQR